MMLNFVLYCCTFRKDLLRTVKLAESICKHNKNKIPFYISVPADDVELFKEYLKEFNAIIFDADNPVELAYYLGKNPGELDKLGNMNGFQAARYIGRIEKIRRRISLD